jgi:hypothetical protein
VAISANEGAFDGVKKYRLTHISVPEEKRFDSSILAESQAF